MTLWRMNARTRLRRYPGGFGVACEVMRSTEQFIVLANYDEDGKPKFAATVRNDLNASCDRSCGGYNADVRYIPLRNPRSKPRQVEHLVHSNHCSHDAGVYHHPIFKGDIMGTSHLAGRLFSCREAAAILSVSDDTVRRLIHSGKLEGVRISSRILRVFGESLDRCMDADIENNRLVVRGEATWSVRTGRCQPAASSKGSVGGNSQPEGGVA